MLFRVSVVTFILASLLGNALAAVPQIVYRSTKNSPKTVKEQNGLNCAQPTSYNDKITAQMHITKIFKIDNKNISPLKDPWVSTTYDHTTLVGTSHATSSGYIYKIDTSGREASFQNAEDIAWGSKGNPYASEKEVSAWVNIPWNSIMGWSRNNVYTPNPDYAGGCEQSGALKKRGLGGKCAARKQGAAKPKAAAKPKQAAGAKPARAA
ncbi:hypothetical protein Daus18300_008244 [Diaporthe australafricana]|uniref:Cholera enterotoxin subunit A2 n=1 Tax=Diaporthe australafricana TaxID=127596 RepID=A0ABR3WJC5_9PEZI